MEYNLKIDYLCSKKMSGNIIYHSGDETYYRDIFNSKRYDLIDELAKDIYNMKNIIAYIKEEETTLSFDSINHILKILEANTFYKQETLSDIIYEYKNNFSPNTAIDSFIKIIKKDVFNSRELNIKMAVIIHNFMLYKKDVSPIIFHLNYLEEIYEKIKENKLDEARNIIFIEYSITSIYNFKHKEIHLDYIESKLNEFYEEYKDTYKLDSIFIYGSFSRGDERIYSDLDIYLIVNDKSIIKTKRLEIASVLYKLLELNIDLSIDITSEAFKSLNDHQKSTLYKIKWLKLNNIKTQT